MFALIEIKTHREEYLEQKLKFVEELKVIGNTNPYGVLMTDEEGLIDIESHGQIEEIKNVIKDDPELKSFIEEGDIALDEAPFRTKEEAIMVLVEKIGVAKLVSMKSNYEKGTLSKKEVLQTIEENLSEEEITALQVVACRELVGTGSLSISGVEHY